MSLVLIFTDGLAYIRNAVTGVMMSGKSMAGWAYGISANLDFTAFDFGDPNDPHKAAPVLKNVTDQVLHFTSNEWVCHIVFVHGLRGYRPDALQPCPNKRG